MAAPTLAIFDFDQTLIRGDSLWPFLVLAAGWPRAVSAAVVATLQTVLTKTDDRRTLFKAVLLRRALAGLSAARAKQAAEALEDKIHWLPTRERLQQHWQQGHIIIIASGGLDLYLPNLLRDLPPHQLICTQLEIADGRLTGAMQRGNCVRQAKADKVQQALKALGVTGDSWGYGNFPHDVPMLALVNQRVII